MKHLYFTILLIFLISFPLSATEEGENADKEEFNIFSLFSYEHPVKKSDDEKKWSMNIGAGYMENKGNTESLDLSYSAGIIIDDSITTFKLNLLGFYGETKGILDENRWNAIGNFDHYLIYRLEFFSFTMSDYNEIIGLQHRNASGAGLKLIFIRNNYLLVDISGAPVYQYEKFRNREKEEEWRWSLRWRGEIAPFNNNISLRYYGYYIPVFSDRDNYRLIHDVYLFVKIAESLGIKAGYRRDFNTYTPELLEALPELKKTDEITYFQLSIIL